MPKAPHPYSYQEIAQAFSSGSLERINGATIVREVTSSGVLERVADLPWTARPTSWMLTFLLCYQKHGREDCFCWWDNYWSDGTVKGKAKLAEGKRPGSRYISWRKSEAILLLSHPLYREPWLREKQRAAAAWMKVSGELPIVASTSIPWAEKLLALVGSGYSPSGAANRLGLAKGAVSNARRNHPELNLHLSKLGYPPQTWRGTFTPPERNAK